MTEGKPMYGIRGGLAHDAGSGSFVSWDNTMCNPLASAREQARSAWEDGYASAQRTWVELTDKDWYEIWEKFAHDSEFVLNEEFQDEMVGKHGGGHYYMDEDEQWNRQKDLIQRIVQAKLKEKNT